MSEVIEQKFFLTDHLPSEQRKWLNLRRAILEDLMKKTEKVKGKKKPVPTKEAKIAKKEYNLVIGFIKNIIADEVIDDEHEEFMGGLFKLFSETIMPSRNIPNGTYVSEEVKKEPKTKKKRKKKKQEEYESGDTLETDPGLAPTKEN